MSPLEVFAVLISVIGVVLTIRRNMLCWGFNLLAYALYAYLFYEYKLYGETILQFFFVGLAIYGFYHWRKGRQEDHQIRIEPISIQKVIVQIIWTSICGFAFGMLLHTFTDAALPLLDSQLAAFSLLATYWTSRKHIATWVLWVFVDIVYVGMFIYKDLFLTAGLYAAFVVLAIWGWRQWLAIRNKQTTGLAV